jgi:hypothetical protein
VLVAQGREDLGRGLCLVDRQYAPQGRNTDHRVAWRTGELTIDRHRLGRFPVGHKPLGAAEDGVQAIPTQTVGCFRGLEGRQCLGAADLPQGIDRRLGYGRVRVAGQRGKDWCGLPVDPGADREDCPRLQVALELADRLAKDRVDLRAGDALKG